MRMSRVFALGVFTAMALAAAASDQEQKAGRLSDLPQAAQPAISAALGRALASYSVKEKGTGFAAGNAQQNLLLNFSADGIEVRSGSAQWRMKPESYGYGNALKPIARAVPEPDGNRIQYRHGALEEWYINGPIGLEQGFTLSRPPGRSGRQELTIELAISGNLRAVVDSQRLNLRDAAGNIRLRYSGLKACDSTGRELAASLALKGDHLLLRVDDGNARYPIVVDPWVQTAELTASDGAAGDQFGWSVAVNGSTVVVGSPFHTVGSNQAQGSAYVFVEPANGWTGMTQTAELAASGGAANAFFGTSVSISGNTIVVGAGSTTVNGNPHQGAAYVFVEPANGWSNMTQTAELTASDGNVGDDFGASVSISGNTVVAGAPYASVGSNFQQGAAYVFVEPSGGWSNMTQTAKLTSSDGAASDIFGDAVAIDSGTVVIGASEATLNGDSSAGKAYVFVAPADGWTDTTQTAELTASDAMADDYFGSSVAISGNTVVVGSPSDFSGAAYVFIPPPGGWIDSTQTAELTPGASSSLLLMGTSVGISGTTVMAGAVGDDDGNDPYEGALYVFIESGVEAVGWTDANQNAQLTPSDGGAGDYFGHALSMSGNAEVVGSPFHQVGANQNQGSAYVFQPVNPPPTETSLSPNNAVAGGPGFQLTVGGANFVQGATVTWNGNARSTTYVSPTEVQAQILASDIATIGYFSVRVMNPAPGGGNSDRLTFTVNNPVPGIGSLSPDQALAGGSSFTLTVNGSNFVSTSKVYWNGAKLPTTFVSNGALKASVSAGDIKNAGTASVTVVNPGPGGGTSNAETFYINNAVPSLSSLSPPSIKAGSPALTLSVYGSGFVSKSQALWNGSARQTTYDGPGKLKVQILKSDVAQAGSAQVTVSNPAPGGGNSNALTFTIKQ